MSTASEKAICVYSLDNNFCEPDLEQLICREDLKDLRVVVISVAGRCGQGKSFLLNFMIRYLRAGGNREWISRVTDELRGFEWKNTRHRVTDGVLIWPEVFKVGLQDGETVAVVLMDTQGVFDTRTTIKDSTMIFSFSMLLSSMQIFNVKQQINGDDLGHLELFSEYGKLLLPNKSDPGGSSKVFQDLVFLIRDWSYASKLPYGWAGGQRLLKEELDKTGLPEGFCSMNGNIRDSFDSLRCFLMPYPGDGVNSAQDLRWSFRDMKMDFLQNLELLLHGLLSPEKLVPKKISGEHVTLQEWCSYVKDYSRHFRESDLPEPKTLFEATMNATNIKLLRASAYLYYDQMLRLVDQGAHEFGYLLEKHSEISDTAVAKLRSSFKMGHETLRSALETELRAKLESIFEGQFVKMNQHRLRTKEIMVELMAQSRECELAREQLEDVEVTRDIEQKLVELEFVMCAAEEELQRIRAELKAAGEKGNCFTWLVEGLDKLTKGFTKALN